MGPEVWTIWKGTLLADLYRRTLDHLVHKRNILPSEEELRQRLRPAIMTALNNHQVAATSIDFSTSCPLQYLVATPEEIASIFA